MVGMVKRRRMLSVMMAWEITQHSSEVASMTPAQMETTLSFRMRRRYQMRSVTERAPVNTAGRRAARSVKPSTL